MTTGSPTVVGSAEPVPSLPRPSEEAPSAHGRLGTDRLARTTAALATNTIVTSALGLVFWLVVSHRYSARQVGVDSALLSSMFLLSTLTELNFSTALPRLLPLVRHRRGRAVALCFLATGAAGAVLAVTFALVVPHFLANMRFLLQSSDLVVAFVAGLMVFNVFAVQDSVLVGSRRATLVPVKNALFGVVKLVVMVALVGRLGGHGIFASWLLAAVFVAVPTTALLFGRILRRSGPSVETQTHLLLEGRRGLVRYLVRDWAAGMLGFGTVDVLPLVVLALLGRAVTGYFYVAFIVATAVASFSQSFSTSLLVEGAHDEASLDLLARRTTIRYATVVNRGLVVAMVVGPFALRAFGAEYSVHAGQVFRLLLLATIPQTAVAIAMSVERVQGRADRVLRYQAVTSACALALVVPLMHVAGLAGIGWAWLGAQVTTAAFVLPTLRSLLASGGPVERSIGVCK